MTDRRLPRLSKVIKHLFFFLAHSLPLLFLTSALSCCKYLELGITYSDVRSYTTSTFNDFPLTKDSGS